MHTFRESNEELLTTCDSPRPHDAGGTAVDTHCASNAECSTKHTSQSGFRETTLPSRPHPRRKGETACEKANGEHGPSWTNLCHNREQGEEANRECDLKAPPPGDRGHLGVALSATRPAANHASGLATSYRCPARRHRSR